MNKEGSCLNYRAIAYSAGAVGGALVLYLLAAAFFRSPNVERQTRGQIITQSQVDKAPTSGRPQSAPATQPGSGLIVQGVPVGPGAAPVLRQFTPQGTLIFELSFGAWEQVSASRIRLAKPKFHMLLSGGQEIYLTGDTGEVLTRPGGKDQVQIQSGWLEGNVQVTINPLNRAQREELKQLAEELGLPAPKPELAVGRLGRVDFDMELQQARSDDAFTIASPQVEMAGKGLLLNWDQVQGAINLLRIERGENLVLYGFGPPTSMEEAGITPADAQRLAKIRERRQKDRAVASQPKPQPSPAAGMVKVDTYQSIFNDNVRCRQLSAKGEMVSAMDCDQLTIDFDTLRGRADPSLAGGSQTPGAKRSGRLEVKWEGPLEVRRTASSIGPAGSSAPATQTGLVTRTTSMTEQKMIVTATGQEVRLQDRQGSLIASKVVYNAQTGEAVVTREGQALVLIGKDGRKLSGQSVQLNQSQGWLRVAGKGYLEEPSLGPGTLPQLSQAPSRVEWTEGMELLFDQTRTTSQPAGGKSAKTGPPRGGMSQLLEGSAVGLMGDDLRNRLKEARFRGKVRLLRGKDKVQAERLDVNMMPGHPGGLGEAITHMVGEGDVLLQRGDDRLTCRQLDVLFAPDAKGRYQPSKAHSRGNVKANQGSRSITCDDLLTFFVTRQKAPANVGGQVKPSKPAMETLAVEQARQLADKIGWNLPLPAPRPAPAPAQQSVTELLVQSLQAEGHVRVEDPAQDMKAKADHLTASVGPENTITDALLVSNDPKDPAKAKSNKYLIIGPRINVNLQKSTASVPGPGQLDFVTDRDLAGSPSQGRGLVVSLWWSKEMILDGQTNKGRFVGNVRADSKTNSLQADQLDLTFEDIKSKTTPPAETRPPADEMAIVQQQMQRKIRGTLRPWGLDWLIKPDAAQQERELTAGAFNKRPMRFDAQGNVVAISRQYAPGLSDLLTSRVRLAGPRLVIDLGIEELEVPAAGTMLIEDYRLMAKKAGVAQTGGEPFFGQFAGTGLSQTLFAWDKSFTYSIKEGLAQFNGKVQMAHRAGADLVPPDQQPQVQELLRQLPANLRGRKASLLADLLLVQFAPREDEKTRGRPAMDRLGQRELSRLVAEGNVGIRDGTRSVLGQRISFDQATETLTIAGSADFEAAIQDLNEVTGQISGWQGPIIKWNRKTNRIEAPGGRAISTGR